MVSGTFMLHRFHQKENSVYLQKAYQVPQLLPKFSNSKYSFLQRTFAELSSHIKINKMC